MLSRQPLQKTGRNIGGYRGDRIEIRSVLDDIHALAQRHRWHKDWFTSNGVELVAYRRQGLQSLRRLYISTGIHGDEPAGPLALRALLDGNTWPEHVDVWVCPCLNLTGFPLNTRESASGVDLNRDYRHLLTPEVRTHVAWLRQQPDFDVAVCLHEDWEANGFYLYELNPDGLPSVAETIIGKVSEVCPIEAAETVDGWPIRNGIIRPQIDPQERPQWAEAVFLVTTKTRQTYTLESASDFPLDVRVESQIVAVRTLLASL